jgi:hypothetical protein
MDFHYSVCSRCIGYIEDRRAVVLPAIANHCDATGEPSADALHRYMTGVHDRHMSGLSLAVSA